MAKNSHITGMSIDTSPTVEVMVERKTEYPDGGVNWSRYVYPTYMKIPIRDITPASIRRVLRAIAKMTGAGDGGQDAKLQAAIAQIDELRSIVGPLVGAWYQYGSTPFADGYPYPITITNEDREFYNTAARVAERLHNLSLGGEQ